MLRLGFTYVYGNAVYVDKFKEAQGAGKEPGIDGQIAWGEEKTRRQPQTGTHLDHKAKRQPVFPK